MFNKKNKISFLSEKWVVIDSNVKLKYLPRIHELVYLNNVYYRVANIIYNIGNAQDIYIIIEEYTDDYNLFEKKD
tara:strand:+ start:881 stop:1105 length:225 start_codon:yes stop_codon:yes gene_type:complete